MNIEKNITNIRLTLPDNVTLVVVSKTQPPAKILEAYDCGQRIFGEALQTLGSNHAIDILLAHECHHGLADRRAMQRGPVSNNLKRSQ